jgi:hypothetical protein
MQQTPRLYRTVNLFVPAFLLLIVVACGESTPPAADASSVTRAEADLKALSQIIAQAQRNSKGTLTSITASPCTDCACRERDLRKVADNDVCAAAWMEVVKRLEKLQDSGTSAKAPVRDPWGSPYALDENQGETGSAGCSNHDRLRSVGPDGRWGTADDIVVDLPLSASCP